MKSAATVDLTRQQARAIRERIEADATLFDADDWGACNCMDGAG